jgi:hypothetical protein
MPLSKRQREFVEHLLVCEETGMTDKDWAALMGLSAGTCQEWKKRPDVKDALDAARKEYDAGASVLGRKTFTWALEEAVVNYRKSLKADDMREARQWWLTIKNLTEPEARSSARVDYGAWSIEDLGAEVFRRGLTPTEAALEELAGVKA